MDPAPPRCLRGGVWIRPLAAAVGRPPLDAFAEAALCVLLGMLLGKHFLAPAEAAVLFVLVVVRKALLTLAEPADALVLGKVLAVVEAVAEVSMPQVARKGVGHALTVLV